MYIYNFCSKNNISVKLFITFFSIILALFYADIHAQSLTSSNAQTGKSLTQNRVGFKSSDWIQDSSISGSDIYFVKNYDYSNNVACLTVNGINCYEGQRSAYDFTNIKVISCGTSMYQSTGSYGYENENSWCFKIASHYDLKILETTLNIFREEEERQLTEFNKAPSHPSLKSASLNNGEKYDAPAPRPLAHDQTWLVDRNTGYYYIKDYDHTGNIACLTYDRIKCLKEADTPGGLVIYFIKPIVCGPSMLPVFGHNGYDADHPCKELKDSLNFVPTYDSSIFYASDNGLLALHEPFKNNYRLRLSYAPYAFSYEGPDGQISCLARNGDTGCFYFVGIGSLAGQDPDDYYERPCTQDELNDPNNWCYIVRTKRQEILASYWETGIPLDTTGEEDDLDRDEFILAPHYEGTAACLVQNNDLNDGECLKLSDLTTVPGLLLSGDEPVLDRLNFNNVKPALCDTRNVNLEDNSICNRMFNIRLNRKKTFIHMPRIAEKPLVTNLYDDGQGYFVEEGNPNLVCVAYPPGSKYIVNKYQYSDCQRSLYRPDDVVWRDAIFLECADALLDPDNWWCKESQRAYNLHYQPKYPLGILKRENYRIKNPGDGDAVIDLPQTGLTVDERGIGACFTIYGNECVERTNDRPINIKYTRLVKCATREMERLTARAGMTSTSQPPWCNSVRRLLEEGWYKMFTTHVDVGEPGNRPLIRIPSMPYIENFIENFDENSQLPGCLGKMRYPQTCYLGFSLADMVRQQEGFSPCLADNSGGSQLFVEYCNVISELTSANIANSRTPRSTIYNYEDLGDIYYVLNHGDDGYPACLSYDGQVCIKPSEVPRNRLGLEQLRYIECGSDQLGGEQSLNNQNHWCGRVKRNHNIDIIPGADPAPEVPLIGQAQIGPDAPYFPEDVKPNIITYHWDIQVGDLYFLTSQLIDEDGNINPACLSYDGETCIKKSEIRPGQIDWSETQLLGCETLIAQGYNPYGDEASWCFKIVDYYNVDGININVGGTSSSYGLRRFPASSNQQIINYEGVYFFWQRSVGEAYYILNHDGTGHPACLVYTDIPNRRCIKPTEINPDNIDWDRVGFLSCGSDEASTLYGNLYPYGTDDHWCHNIVKEHDLGLTLGGSPNDVDDPGFSYDDEGSELTRHGYLYWDIQDVGEVYYWFIPSGPDSQTPTISCVTYRDSSRCIDPRLVPIDRIDMEDAGPNSFLTCDEYYRANPAEGDPRTNPAHWCYKAAQKHGIETSGETQKLITEYQAATEEQTRLGSMPIAISDKNYMIYWDLDGIGDLFYVISEYTSGHPACINERTTNKCLTITRFGSRANFYREIYDYFTRVEYDWALNCLDPDAETEDGLEPYIDEEHWCTKIVRKHKLGPRLKDDPRPLPQHGIGFQKQSRYYWNIDKVGDYYYTFGSYFTIEQPTDTEKQIHPGCLAYRIYSQSPQPGPGYECIKPSEVRYDMIKWNRPGGVTILSCLRPPTQFEEPLVNPYDEPDNMCSRIADTHYPALKDDLRESFNNRYVSRDVPIDDSEESETPSVYDDDIAFKYQSRNIFTMSQNMLPDIPSSEWRYLPDENIYYVLDYANSGHPACLSYDHYRCEQGPDAVNDIIEGRVKAAPCGPYLYKVSSRQTGTAISGYDNPNHWCSKVLRENNLDIPSPKLKNGWVFDAPGSQIRNPYYYNPTGNRDDEFGNTVCVRAANGRGCGTSLEPYLIDIENLPIYKCGKDSLFEYYNLGYGLLTNWCNEYYKTKYFKERVSGANYFYLKTYGNERYLYSMNINDFQIGCASYNGEDCIESTTPYHEIDFSKVLPKICTNTELETQRHWCKEVKDNYYQFRILENVSDRLDGLVYSTRRSNVELRCLGAPTNDSRSFLCAKTDDVLFNGRVNSLPIHNLDVYLCPDNASTGDYAWCNQLKQYLESLAAPSSVSSDSISSYSDAGKSIVESALDKIVNILSNFNIGISPNNNDDKSIATSSSIIGDKVDITTNNYEANTGTNNIDEKVANFDKMELERELHKNYDSIFANVMSDFVVSYLPYADKDAFAELLNSCSNEKLSVATIEVDKFTMCKDGFSKLRESLAATSFNDDYKSVTENFEQLLYNWYKSPDLNRLDNNLKILFLEKLVSDKNRLSSGLLSKFYRLMPLLKEANLPLEELARNNDATKLFVTITSLLPRNTYFDHVFVDSMRKRLEEYRQTNDKIDDYDFNRNRKMVILASFEALGASVENVENNIVKDSETNNLLRDSYQRLLDEVINFADLKLFGNSDAFESVMSRDGLRIVKDTSGITYNKYQYASHLERINNLLNRHKEDDIYVANKEEIDPTFTGDGSCFQNGCRPDIKSVYFKKVEKCKNDLVIYTRNGMDMLAEYCNDGNLKRDEDEKSSYIFNNYFDRELYKIDETLVSSKFSNVIQEKGSSESKTKKITDKTAVQ